MMDCGNFGICFSVLLLSGNGYRSTASINAFEMTRETDDSQQPKQIRYYKHGQSKEILSTYQPVLHIGMSIELCKLIIRDYQIWIYLNNGDWWKWHEYRQDQRTIVCISVHAACASAGQAAQSLCRNASECRTRPYESWRSAVHRADDEKPCCFCVQMQLFSLYLQDSHAEEKPWQKTLWRNWPECFQPVFWKLWGQDWKKVSVSYVASMRAGKLWHCISCRVMNATG